MAWRYHAVAAGMWSYSHPAFRVAFLGPERLPLEPGTLVVSTHRRETDVPVVAPVLYQRARLWTRRRPLERLNFAARDDLFLPGFFAGFPAGLPPRVRRLLFPVGVGRWLPRVQVYPLRSASVARRRELLREWGDDPLAELVPEAEADLRRRAAACGLAPPVRGADALRAEYADLLWRPVSRDALPPGLLERFWSRRAAQSAADFRALVELLRAGGVLLVFPEGRPSPDGDIGPVRRGLAALVRRGQPGSIQPVAPAYDPLARRRTRVFVSLGDAVPPPPGDVDDAVLALLRRTTPLTCGQAVAAHVAGSETASTRAVRAAVAEAVAAGHAEGRPIEPDLLDRGRRARRVDEALAALPRRRGAAAYLAREYRSSRL